jgi:Trk K+ transport system NAD-binding subunit
MVTSIVHRVQAKADDRSLSDRRFVVHGDGRLVKAVIRLLKKRGARVHLVPPRETAERDLAQALDGQVSCVLALDDRHENNLRAALVVAEANEKRTKARKREIPVVVRAFDPKLADEIERRPEGQDARLRIRGAYSVAHLAAPDFVVAALVDEGEKNLVTLRLGDQYVNVCRLRVCASDEGTPRRRRRPLLGRTPVKLLEDEGCQVLARRRLAGGEWTEAGHAPLEADEEVLVGGQLLEVLRLVRRQSAGGPSAPPHRTARLSGRRRTLARTAEWKIRRAMASAGTLGTRVMIGLFVLVTVAVLLAPGDSASGKVYLWVLTAVGNPPLDEKVAEASPLVSAVGLLAGGLAVGVGISMMSAHMMERRTIETNRRHARRQRNHVVIVGLGDVGLRISQLLEDLGVDCAVVDTAMGTEMAKRRGQAPRVPVVQADLEAGLRDARIDRAFSLIATSDDNLLNVEACLRAKRERSEHVRTIARIFDDVVADYGKESFGVDDQISAAEVAAQAFVDAALDEHCLRPINVAGWPMAALRWPEGNPVGERQLKRWHMHGIRLLAVWRRGDDEPARPDAKSPEICDDQAAILVGPKEAMDDVLHELRSRSAPRRLTAAA